MTETCFCGHDKAEHDLTEDEGDQFCFHEGCGCNNFHMPGKDVITYHVQKMHKPKSIVHRAEPLENNENYCSTECGRWLDVDKYIVTTRPVTCARCLVS